MSDKSNAELSVTFTPEKMERLKNAKSLFESDTAKSIDLDAFIDMLVETYLSYRNTRGPTESSLLQKITNNP